MKSARLPAEVISGEVEIHWGDFTRILYEAVRNDVNYRFGVRVTALADNSRGLDVTFSDGSTGSYDLVIGADGLHSGTRRLVFGPEERYVTQLGQCFGFFDIENRLRLDHCGMAYIDAGRTAALQGIDPDKPARASLFLSDPHVAFDYRDTEGSKRLFVERYAGMGWEVPTLLDGLAEAPEVYFDSIAQVHLDSYARGRVCLTGDAAWAPRHARAWVRLSRWSAPTCWLTKCKWRVTITPRRSPDTGDYSRHTSRGVRSSRSTP